MFYEILEVLVAIAFILRAFSTTRKIGNSLIVSLAIIFIFLPIIFSAIPSPKQGLNETLESMQEINNNPDFEQRPIAQMNQNNAVADMIDNMKAKGYVEELNGIADVLGKAVSFIAVYYLVPILDVLFVVFISIAGAGFVRWDL